MNRLLPAVALLSLALLLAPVAAGSGSHAPAVAAAVITPAAFGISETQTSTVGATFDGAITLWHNSTSLNQSVAKLYPVNVTGYTSLTGFSSTLTISSGSNVPVLNVTQGTTDFINGSVSGQLAFSPTAGSTELSVDALQLFTLAGAPVAVGTYVFWVNDTETGQFSRAVSSAWVLTSTVFSISYTVTAPYLYYLNGTTVFIPFPSGVQVNGTSVAVTGATSYQAQQNGVYLNNASLAPDKSVTMKVTFDPVPVTTGSVLITLTKPALVAGSASVYGGTASWTNTGTLPYEGLYAISIGFAYPIDPGSLSLYVDGVKMVAGDYTLQSSTLIVIPGVLLVGAQTSAYFNVTFSSLTAPPAGSLTTVGGYSLAGAYTVSDFVLTGLALAGVYMLYNAALGDARRKRGEPPGVRKAILNSTLLIVVLLALYLVMNRGSL